MRAIPFSVGKLLERAIARVRRITLVRGFALVGIVWLLAVAAVMLVDSRIVIFDDRIRWAMSLGALLLALLTSVFALMRPLRRRMDFARMARMVDARHPELEERFSTLVELSSADPDARGFSASLFGLVGDLAERDLGKVDLRHDFPARAALRRLAVFLALALTLVVGIAVSPQIVGRLFVRAVAPWADIGNLFANDIAVTPGDIVALSGTVIKIEAEENETSAVRLSSSPSPFTIRLSRKTSLGWTPETVETMANGVYETTADPNEREWRYRVTAGRAVTRYYHVRVSMMPKYDLFKATVTYPAYTEMSPLVVSNAEVGAIRAIQGSRVDFDLRVSDPDTYADFQIGKKPVFTHTMVSNRTINWSLDLVNRDGFRAEKGSHPLTSFVDQPPTVVIEKPTGTLRLPPHAKIPVEITASDDVAVTSAYLRVSIDNEPWTRHYGTAVDEPAKTKLYRTVADVDLSLYDLILAKNIRFDVVVSDACPPEFGGPHSATSTPFTVQFAANEANWNIQELRSEVAEARQQIEEARKRLNDAQNQARRVSDALRREQNVSDATERQSETLAHELAQAERRIEELRDEFLSDERFAPLTRPLDRILDETLKPAVEAVENAPFRERTERADAVADAMPEMEKARQELEDFAKQLAERADKVDAFEKARDLADRQEALAKAAREITSERPLDTAKLEAWKRLEEAAMAQADQLARQNPDSDFAEAKRKMETAAREMAQLKQELDAAKAESNRLAKAAAQKQPEFVPKASATLKLPTEKLQDLARDLAAAAEQQQAAQKALDDVAASRAEAARQRRSGVSPLEQDKKSAAAAKVADKAQKDAEDLLKRGEATEGTKAMQQLADKAAAASQKKPHDVARAERAAAAQRAASKALDEERQVREAMAKGEKTAADLEAFDRAAQAAAKEASAAFDEAEQKAAAADQLASRQLDASTRDLNQAVGEQKRAADAIKRAGQKRAEEARARAAGKQNDAEARAREAQNFERQAAEAQRSAEDRLERSGATEGVKALQQQATTAARNAHKAPQAKEKYDLAEAAQKAATEALQNELKIREGIRRGEMTEADLAALDDQLKAGLLQNAGKRTQAAKEAAAEAIRKAKDVIGTEEDEQLGTLAAAALEAARDAVSSELSESKLRDNDSRADALRGTEDELDAISSETEDEQALEERIGRLQQSAADALARNDRWRALNLQKDIARAQARAADNVNETDETAARAAANDAQARAAEAIEKASRQWNDETKAQAIAAQKAAIESEQTAQAEAQSVRALSRLSAAEKALARHNGEAASSPLETKGEAASSPLEEKSPSSSLPADAADEASDAMSREVNAQAAALGMSKRRADAGAKNDGEKSGESAGGGGVSEEVAKLASDLQRKDSPDFFKSLFSRLGWFKIRSISKDGLGTSDLKEVPREYRDLVRRYFLKLSEENP